MDTSATRRPRAMAAATSMAGAVHSQTRGAGPNAQRFYHEGRARPSLRLYIYRRSRIRGTATMSQCQYAATRVETLRKCVERMQCAKPEELEALGPVAGALRQLADDMDAAKKTLKDLASPSRRAHGRVERAFEREKSSEVGRRCTLPRRSSVLRGAGCKPWNSGGMRQRRSAFRGMPQCKGKRQPREATRIFSSLKLLG